MKIACLGWGSLIWKPGALPVAQWHADGPQLPLEFARHSSGERLTLVLTPDVSTTHSLWGTLALRDLADAIEALRIRESTSVAQIGFWSPKRQSTHVPQAIALWATAKGLDGLVWTALPPKWKERDHTVPTRDEVVEFCRRQGNDSEAHEYVIKAPRQVRTTYRSALEAELGWLPEA